MIFRSASLGAWKSYCEEPTERTVSKVPHDRIETEKLLSQTGEQLSNVGEDHLLTVGITPEDMGDCYTQMFRLGFARVAIEGKGFHIEAKQEFTEPQQQVIDEAVREGKEVFVNNKHFLESKGKRGSAD